MSLAETQPAWTGCRALVVDDEEPVRELLKLYLAQEGFAVAFAGDGMQALKLHTDWSPHLILLDLMLPGVDGMEVCRRIRASSYVPIIMVTARSEEIDRIVGLELGADDYVIKPFSAHEVVARVKAVLRRAWTGPGQSEVLTFPSLRLDPSGRRVEVEGEEVHLPRIEFEILWLLARHPRRVLSRAEIGDEVWGEDAKPDPRTVEVHLKRLRHTLEEARCQCVITTVWGVGYRFDVPSADGSGSATDQDEALGVA